MSGPKQRDSDGNFVDVYDDIYDDPKFGPMMRQLDALDLPSAYAPANPDAPVQELSGAGLLSTEGHNNARATAKAAARKKSTPPKGAVGGAKVQVPSADADIDDDADVLVALPEGDRGQRTRVMPAVIPWERKRQWWRPLLVLLLVLGVFVAFAAYFKPKRVAPGDDAGELDPAPKPTGFAPEAPVNATATPADDDTPAPAIDATARAIDATARAVDNTASPSAVVRPSARVRASAWTAPSASAATDVAAPDDGPDVATPDASANVLEPPEPTPPEPTPTTPSPKPSNTVDLFHQ